MVRSYHAEFPETDDAERNIMINLVAQDIGPKLLSYFDVLRLEIGANRYKIEINQPEERGLDDVCRVVRKLREECELNSIKLTV